MPQIIALCEIPQVQYPSEFRRFLESQVRSGFAIPTKNHPFGWFRNSDRRDRAQTEKLEPQPQDEVALGLWKTNPRPMISSLKSMVTPLR